MTKMYNNKTWTIGNDLEVNRYGYGAMRITGKGVGREPGDEDQAIIVLKMAVDMGVNFIDTADRAGKILTRSVNRQKKRQVLGVNYSSS